MITFEEFQRSRLYPDTNTARKKYIAALFRFGSFGGILTSSFGNPPPPAKRQTTSSSSTHLISHPVLQSRRLSIRPEMIDDHGFVESINLAECEVQEELRKYLPSKQFIQEVLPMFISWRTIRLPTVGSETFFQDTSEFYESVQATVRAFLRIPEAERVLLERPDMTTPVYLRDHCTSMEHRNPTRCVPRIFYYFGACGIPTDELAIYLSNVPGFERLFPYVIMSPGCPHTALETIARRFFEDDRYDVALYSILSTPNADGLHGGHMRFAVKDRQARKIVLFDPHGDFNLVDKHISDQVVLSNVLRRMTEGVQIQIAERNVTDRTVDVLFLGFGGSVEWIRNVPEQYLFNHVSIHTPALYISPGHVAVYKVPRESVHFTEVVRSTSNAANFGYEGDQPSEGSCALISLMRAAHIVLACSKRPLANPMEFVTDSIECHFAVFVSMLAQAFNYKPKNFKAEKLDSARPGVRFSVEGLRDNMWLNTVPKNKSHVPIFKILRSALHRAAFITQTDISTNPFKYRFKVVNSTTTKYHALMSNIDLTCLNDPATCQIVIEPLPTDNFNVTVFIKYEDKRDTVPVPTEVILSQEFIRTKRLKHLSLGFPFDPFTQVLVNYERMWIETSLHLILKLESGAMHSDIMVLRKPSVIRVHYFSNLSVKPGNKGEPDQVVEWSIRPESTVGDILAAMKQPLSPGVPDSDRFRIAYTNEDRDQRPLSEESLLTELFIEDEFVFYKLRKLSPIATIDIYYYPRGSSDEETLQIDIQEDTTVADIKNSFNETIHDGVERKSLQLYIGGVELDDHLFIYPRYDLQALRYT